MTLSRREWLGAGASLIGLTVLGGVPLAAQSPAAPGGLPPITPDQIAPPRAPAKIMIVNRTEPGVPMIIRGRVTDGARPIKGASVFVYHTDARGIYVREKDDNGAEARLRGAMRTDSQGRYEYRTIRPGSYPGTRFPSHVHYAVHASGYKDVFPEFNFDDDPFMNDPGKREFNASVHRPIITMTQDSKGVWHGVFDIVLTRI